MVWVWFDIRRTKYCLQKIIVKGSTLSLAMIAVNTFRMPSIIITGSICAFLSLMLPRAPTKLASGTFENNWAFFCWTLEYGTWRILHRYQAVRHIMSLSHQTLVPSQYSSVPLLRLLTPRPVWGNTSAEESRTGNTVNDRSSVWSEQNNRCNRWELPVQQPCYRIKMYYWANRIAKEAPILIFLSLVFEDLNRFLYEVSLDRIREKQL